MNNLFPAIFLILVMTSSCSVKSSFHRDKALFDRSGVIQNFKSSGEGVDSYFQLKENNFCEFYIQLFDTVKTTVYPGRYTNKGDTLLLNFYDKKALSLLGSKAIMSTNKKEIIFFDDKPGPLRRFIIF